MKRQAIAIFIVLFIVNIASVNFAYADSALESERDGMSDDRIIKNFVIDVLSYIYDILSSDSITIVDIITGVMVLIMVIFIGGQIKVFGGGTDIIIFGLMGIMMFFIIVGATIQSASIRIIIRTILYAGTFVFMYYAFTGILLLAIGVIKHKFRSIAQIRNENLYLDLRNRK